MPWIISSKNQRILDRLVQLADGDIFIVEKAANNLKSELGRTPKLQEVVLRIVSENRVIAHNSN